MLVKMKARLLSETSGNTKPATKCYIPKDLNPQRQRFMWILGYESRILGYFFTHSLLSVDYKHVPKIAK